MVLAALFICGCAHSPVPRYYLLTPVSSADPASTLQNLNNPVIVLRPVTIASYLNRPQIVIRKGEREVSNLQFDRWAEPLNTLIDNALSETLAEKLTAFNIKPFPWYGKEPPLCEVQVSVQYLDGIPDESVRLQASWQILSGKDVKEVILDETGIIKAECTQAGIPGVVAATENLIQQLGLQISDAVVKYNPK
jgi:hypothetical protein